MAQGTTKSGIGTWTKQHGFWAKNYAQDAASVLDQASAGGEAEESGSFLKVTGLEDEPETHPINLQPWSVRKEYYGDQRGVTDMAMSQEEGLFRAPPGAMSPEAQGAIAAVVGTGGKNIDAYGDEVGVGDEISYPSEGASAAGSSGPQPEIDKTNPNVTAEGVDLTPPGQINVGEEVVEEEVEPAGPGEEVAKFLGDFRSYKDRHPPVAMEETITEEQVQPSFGETMAEAGRSLVEQVKNIIEQMKGFSLTPQEMADLSGMSPDQLRDVYNSLAHQQGRIMHEDPQAWLKVGVPPVVSQEASLAFMGRAPSGGPTVGPGDAAYSQYNIPERQTAHGFGARDYASPTAVGTTDWLRKVYPWARNLPENILIKATQDGEYLRELISRAETGQLLPPAASMSSGRNNAGWPDSWQ